MLISIAAAFDRYDDVNQGTTLTDNDGQCVTIVFGFKRDEKLLRFEDNATLDSSLHRTEQDWSQ